MRVIYVAVNAKYIHSNPAVRILSKLTQDIAVSSFVEFTINDSDEKIIEALVQMPYDMLGFSCYIWNIEKIKRVVTLLKQRYPDRILFAGGPEVSYDTPVAPFDYLLKGDGELSIRDFLLYQKVPATALYVNTMQQVPFIGDLYTKDDLQNRIIYMETTRGCPYRCSYCLASIQLDHVIFKDEEKVQQELLYYIERGAKTIKFLDRSFNVNPSRFMRFLSFLNTLNSEHTFQFEIAANLLNKEVMNYLSKKVKPGLVRLEIGIQSTLQKANEAVDRFDDIGDTLAKIKQLVQAGRVVIHADLIVGLPYENYARAQTSFNEVFLLFPHELQLGFLKKLKGTKLAKDAARYGYEFAPLPPYEIIDNLFISQSEIQQMKLAEIGLESLWNRKRLLTTIQHLVKEKLIDPYLFFEEMGRCIKKDAIKQETSFYELVYRWALTHSFDLTDHIKRDYLMKNRVRPKRFWGQESQSFPQLKKAIMSLDLLPEKSIQNAFITEIKGGYLLIVYTPHQQVLMIKNKLLVVLA